MTLLEVDMVGHLVSTKGDTLRQILDEAGVGGYSNATKDKCVMGVLRCIYSGHPGKRSLVHGLVRYGVLGSSWLIDLGVHDNA